ncbi:addiction module protein [Nodosilinea sp. LEGE 07088]|uniref:addiction module protein n=1 Tax=Nodosilinea sp. LEGE 07088 TaxID=2777968 RepID=UPI00187E83CB|nr:addiction module protein [Nodosilinea sp. LEGE 07088]MBE9138820.1 addiction module protein [Nodosilinea sp. LEGE 07088]
MDSVLLKEAALKLSPFERAQLIDALWQSLDPAEQAEIDAAWLEESQDRLAAYRQGEVEAVDGESALASLRENLSQ